MFLYICYLNKNLSNDNSSVLILINLRCSRINFFYKTCILRDKMCFRVLQLN